MRTIKTLINQGCAIRGVPVRVNGELFFVSHSVLSNKKSGIVELIVLENNPILFQPQNLVIDGKELSKIK